MIQHNANDIYRGQYIRGQYGTESNHVENDEIIAYTLQEEYSRLSVAEASGCSHGDEEQLQASTHADDGIICPEGIIVQGPRMVRDVFRLAKENAPAIIFIDEVDAIATAR
ncbi:hypothetical protein ABKV19_014164 [Rosa sericea]